MNYLGGKWRQRRIIVEMIKKTHPDFKVYVEPFCGAMWSATAVMKEFPGRRYVLNDVNPYLMKFWKSALDGWDPPQHISEQEYLHYSKTRPMDDPMTGYIGFAWSFGGKFFAGYARGKTGSISSTRKKIDIIRSENCVLSCFDYKMVKIEGTDGGLKQMVYLDPPYAGRTAQAKNGAFNHDDYLAYARAASIKAIVIATEFNAVPGWDVLHNWGDTVHRHLNAKPSDGTCELLMRVRSLSNLS
jgi:DNA adenine methylase